MPRVSVIISAYNHERFIGPAIRSVLDQTFTDLELIVTDDCSKDGTLQEIRKFQDPRLKVFASERNRGGPSGANHGLAHATGDYVAFTGSDDIFYPNKLERQVAFLDAHPEMLAVFSPPSFIDEDGNRITKDHPCAHVFTRENRSREAWLQQFFFRGNCLCQPSALVRREFHDRIGGFHPMLHQLWDLDFWVRLSLEGPLHIMDEELLAYRVLANHGNASAATPETSSATEIEYFWILHHFLKPAVLEHLGDIFGPEWAGRSHPAAARLALAEIASQTESPLHRLFAGQALLNTATDGLAADASDELLSRARILLRQADGFRLQEKILLEKEVRSLEEKLDTLRGKLDKSRVEAAAARERIADLRQQREDTQNSLSWKAAKPLRALDRLFKRKHPPAAE